MSENETEERRFQYALTKAQVDFEFWFALAIGMLAIAYGLLSFYKNDPYATWVLYGLLVVTTVFLWRIYYLKEERFKNIKDKYIDKQNPKN